VRGVLPNSNKPHALSFVALIFYNTRNCTVLKETKIVVLDAYVANPGDYSWGTLEEFGSCRIWQRTESPFEVLERAAGAEIVLTDKVEIRRALLEKLPALRMISVLATGYNVVDIAAAKELGIVVCNVPNYSTSSVTQHVFAVLLQLLHHTDSYARAVAEGAWCRSPDFTIFLESIRELEGMTLGIIGYGAIGSSVAAVARAFGMRILASSRKPKELAGVHFTDLPSLLSQSDVVSLHCPQTEQTSGLINRQTLAQMKKGAILINAARGGLLDEEAVAEALNSGHLSAAALDVLSTEPPSPDNPLLKAKNCLITPHIAWAGLNARRRLLEVTFNNIRAYLEGKPLNVVNP
jgi:glycerate dehydrogenase